LRQGAWTAFAPGQSSADVRFARLDATGTAVLGPVTVASGGATAQAVAVFPQADGHLLFFDTDNELRVVRLAADGTPLTSEVVARGVYHPVVAATSAGFFATWEESSGARDVYGVALDGTGALTAQPIALVATAGDEPAALQTAAGTLVAYGSGDGFGVAVLDVAGAVIDGPIQVDGTGVARAIAMDGKADGSVMLVHRGQSARTELQFTSLSVGPLQQNTSPQAIPPSNFDAWTSGGVAVDSAGRFVVAHVVDDGTLLTRIAVQSVDADQGAGPSLTLTADGRASCPALVSLSGGLLVAFVVERLQTRALMVQDVAVP